MRNYLFGNMESSILECDQKGVRSSQGCKEAVLENLASNIMKKKDQREIVELCYDFEKANDNVNHTFLERLLGVYGFPHGIRILIIEMMSRWRIRLSYGRGKRLGMSALRTASFKAMPSRLSFLSS